MKPGQVPGNALITKQRSGKRPGAGRKPNLAKRLLKGFSKETIAEAMQEIDCIQTIKGLLKSRSERIRLETLIFMWDRVYGRPVQQQVSVNAELTLEQRIYSMSDEEMASRINELLGRMSAKSKTIQ
jgi:hypothetical protein